MQSKIPSTVYDQIVQTNSSPETIAALLNEAEGTFSNAPLYWTAKRRYPFWKVCQVCQKTFPCLNRYQAERKKTCSKGCANAGGPRVKKELGDRKGMAEIACAVCGKQVWKPKAWLKKVKTPTCSRHCNGILRGRDLGKHGYKGRSAWTETSRASYRMKMSGAGNPAWKGGVHWHKQGKYQSVKLVRCPPEFLPMACWGGYVREHRLIVAQHLGRCLKRSEVVHHADRNRENNSPGNLLLFASNSQHKRYEATGQPAPLWRL